jgi:murein DD-endopeptidase MepM/ murein hydrolase activator NlpD
MQRFYWFLMLIVSGLSISACKEETNEKNKGLAHVTTALETEEEQVLFGLPLSQFEVTHDTVRAGWTLSHLLLPWGVGQADVNRIDVQMKDSTIGVKYIVEGKPFTVFTDLGDTANLAKHIFYQPDVFSYIHIDLTQDTAQVRRVEKEVSIQNRIIFGEIAQNESLSLVLGRNFSNYSLTAAMTEMMEGIYAWSIDFFKLQPGDRFAVAFEEKIIDDAVYGIRQIDFAWFEHKGDGKFAFRYTTDSTANKIGYYDEEGRAMKRPFLMSPVQFARITSGYTMSRKHPVYKDTRPHLGTDYAAPTGTPILATADGTVTHATRSGANGIYVKLHHNETYQTQYLHMSKIADGIKPGVRVQQGQVIGYVGMTGAATGPHVCYRFWKNGKQVNHREEKIPNSEPMDEALIPDFLAYIQPKKEKLQAIIDANGVGVEEL